MALVWRAHSTQKKHESEKKHDHCHSPQATFAWGSWARWASSTASLIWSHILSRERKDRKNEWTKATRHRKNAKTPYDNRKPNSKRNISHLNSFCPSKIIRNNFTTIFIQKLPLYQSIPNLFDPDMIGSPEKCQKPPTLLINQSLAYSIQTRLGRRKSVKNLPLY